MLENTSNIFFYLNFFLFRNLITSEDIYPPKNMNDEIPIANIHTINEANEEEEEAAHTTTLLVNIFY